LNLYEKFLLLVALGVILPLVLPLRLAVTTSPPVENVYKEIESLEPGTPVIVSVDYDPSTQPELSPMTVAVLRHCFARDLPVILTTHNPGGAGLALEISDRISKEAGAVYGEDYVFMGYKVGGAAVILSLGQDFRVSFPQDYFRTPIDEIPLMKNVKNYNDIGLVVSLAGNVIPEFWVAYAYERYGQKVAAGVTAVMAADFYPYLQTGQLVGLIGGLKGAAEVHLLIVVFIILGNAAYIFVRRAKRREA
jgi:hypothetical protein